MGHKGRKQFISMDVQIFNMRRRFPNFTSQSIRGRQATWIGSLHPTPLSTIYKLKVQYALDSRPKIWVLSPELEKRTDQDKIPHVYSGDRLCLYLPWANEWHPNLLISETIMPWSSLWLYYYEIWHATGEWLGGGEHPDVAKHDSDS